MASSVVGLEITEESVRAVELTVGRTPTLLASGEVALPAGAAKDSEVIDSDAVALALTQLWSQAGIKNRKVTLGVGSRRILVREHSAPLMSPELLKQALPYQVQDLLPVPVNQAVLDFYPVSQEGGQVHGLLVAAVSETIEALIATLAKAKLHTDAVDLVPFGLARVAGVVGAQGETVAMVHIGDHTSYLVVAVDGVPQFVRIIPIDIATERSNARVTVDVVEEELAELVAVSGARTRGTSIRAGRGDGSDPVVSDLVSRLRSTLAFSAARPGAAPVTTVHVSGAGAQHPGVLAALTASLDVPLHKVEIGDLVTTKTADAVGGEYALNLVSTIGIVLGEGK